MTESDTSDSPDLPLLNIRWSYALAFFVLPGVLAGIDEGSVRAVAVFAGAELALVVCLSVMLWAIESEHWLATVCVAGTISAVVVAIGGLVLALVLVLADATSVVGSVLVAWLVVTASIVGYWRRR